VNPEAKMSDLQWVTDELRKRGISTQDVADAWACSKPKVTRWLGTQPNGRQILLANELIILAGMLGLEIQELSDRLGYDTSPGPKLRRTGVIPRRRTPKVNSHQRR
jgi:Glu-tRNA(Gln) amidotransferase subunit E-like FAD-binding protein